METSDVRCKWKVNVLIVPRTDGPLTTVIVCAHSVQFAAPAPPWYTSAHCMHCCMPTVDVQRIECARMMLPVVFVKTISCTLVILSWAENNVGGEGPFKIFPEGMEIIFRLSILCSLYLFIRIDLIIRHVARDEVGSHPRKILEKEMKKIRRRKKKMEKGQKKNKTKNFWQIWLFVFRWGWFFVYSICTTAGCRA